MSQATSLHARVTAIAAAYQGQRGALLPILHAVQAMFGYVPDDAVPIIAQAQNLSRADVHGALSFYPDLRRKPAGRNVLRLCRAEACQALGAIKIANHTQTVLGVSWHQTTADGAITLEPVYCLGLCAAAPCAQFNDRSIARLDIARIDAIVASAE